MPSRHQRDLKQAVTQRGGVHPQQTPIPTLAGDFLVAVEFLAQGALGAKLDQQLIQWPRTNGAQGDGADTSVFRHAGHFLQQTDGHSHALVDGAIEQQQGQASGEIIAVNRCPVVTVIDRRGVVQRQHADIEVGIGALGNAVLRQATRNLAGGWKRRPLRQGRGSSNR